MEINDSSGRKKMKLPISLIILTYNEELNIDYCLSSVDDWVSEIIIVDSFSTDATLEICRKYTDKIYQRKFDNQAMQFNWALDNIKISHDWVMRLDADEFVLPELADELKTLMEDISHKNNILDGIAGFYIKRRCYFMGKWIKHGDCYPMWFLRLFKKGIGRCEELTEEHIVLSEGKTIRLKNDFVDYNRKGLSFWLEKHANWAIGEMYDTLSLMEGNKQIGLIKTSLFSSQEKRRRWLKTNLYSQLPLFVRAFMYFFYRYFVRLGFLDGVEGLIFHFLQGLWYRFYVDAKIYEAKKQNTWETNRLGIHGSGSYQAAGRIR